MTYLGAAGKADRAKASAQTARAHFADFAQQQLADSVAQLAESVAELARSLHRNSE